MVFLVGCHFCLPKKNTHTHTHKRAPQPHQNKNVEEKEKKKQQQKQHEKDELTYTTCSLYKKIQMKLNLNE